MFDIGMAEMVVIGVVALIVVGPKDLPMMFRKVGQFVGRMRGMARDFQRAMDQAADDSGLKEASDAMKIATSAKNLGLDQVMKTTAAAQAALKPADPLAEHKARVKAVDDANEAAKSWPYGDGEAAADAGAAEVPDAEAKPAKQAASQSATAKQATAQEPTARKKPAAKKTATKSRSSATKSTAKTTKSASAKSAGKTTSKRKPAAKKPTKADT